VQGSKPGAFELWVSTAFNLCKPHRGIASTAAAASPEAGPSVQWYKLNLKANSENSFFNFS
jgi:hypothetical protein